MTNKRKIDEVDPSEEDQAEAELVVAMAAAGAAKADEEIAGLLQPSSGPLLFRVRPTGPNPKQYKVGARFGEKPLAFFYFAIKGLGEVQRLMLAEAGASYDHIAVTGGEEQEAVGSWRARSPNGLLPMMSGLGVPRSAPISQSGATIRFLARRFGLEGETELEAAAADVMYETAKDLSNHKDVITSMPTEADKDMAAKGPWALALRLEKMLAAAPRPEDPDAAMTYGQIQLFHALMSTEDRKPGCIKHLSASLDSFRLAMMARPRIAEYLKSNMCFPYTLGELGKEGGYKYISGPKKRSDFK